MKMPLAQTTETDLSDSSVHIKSNFSAIKEKPRRMGQFKANIIIVTVTTSNVFGQ